MATATRIPVELYLDSMYEPDAEYVDGDVEERPMGEYDHSSWQFAIQRWFTGYQDQWNIRVLPELRVQVSPTRYRVPDMVLLDHARVKEQIITYPPIAVFEILSPEDRMDRVLVKLADYEAMGVKNIVLIDPKQTIVWRYEGGTLFQSRAAEFAGSPCTINWETVIQYLD